MAKRPQAPKPPKPPKPAKAAKNVEALRHTDDKRLNIPTAEHQSVLEAEHVARKEIPISAQHGLGPAALWRGKDYQDWSDLVVQAPPLYIQEKVHPKVLIDDLLRESRSDQAQDPARRSICSRTSTASPRAPTGPTSISMTQNWTNRMILGDSLQVMASLAEREGLRGKVQCISSIRRTASLSTATSNGQRQAVTSKTEMPAISRESPSRLRPFAILGAMVFTAI